MKGSLIRVIKTHLLGENTIYHQSGCKTYLDSLCL